MQRLLCLAREEKLAASAWEFLHLTAPCNLRTVCDFLNYELIRDTLPVKGMFIRSNGVSRVLVSDSLLFQEQRRVIAHEIGHGLSAYHLPMEIELCYEDNESNPVEAEASAFGRCLLVPYAHLVTMVTMFEHTKRHDQTIKLAHHFDVEPSLIQRRLAECGMSYRHW